MPTSGSGFTYISTPTYPVTVKIVNICKLDANGAPQIFREFPVPPGKQLTFKFIAGKGDDPAERPDQLLWEVWDAGTQIGSLRNQMPCPSQWCRRVDVEKSLGNPTVEGDVVKQVTDAPTGESRQPEHDPREIYDP